MRKFTKSRELRTTNDRLPVQPEANATDEDGELDGDILTPHQWLDFAGQFHLSNRELGILILTSRGMARKCIAREFRISLNTLHKLIDRLHKKTRATDRLALTLLLVRFARACH
jgi:DNA-binding CsgD family transcriptional regulator